MENLIDFFHSSGKIKERNQKLKAEKKKYSILLFEIKNILPIDS